MKKTIVTVVSTGIACFIIAYIFVLVDRDKSATKWKEEKENMILAQQKKDSIYQSQVDSLKTEVFFLKSEKIFSSASKLSDLAPVVYFLKSERVGFKSYSLMRKLHPELFAQLQILGLKFFDSEVREISSNEELKKFKRDYKLIGTIVPIYTPELGEAMSIFWRKIKEFEQ